MAPSHYLNQWWDIVYWTFRNKLQWNFNRNSYIFTQENAFENVVWKIAATLSRGIWVKWLCPRLTPFRIIIFKVPIVVSSFTQATWDPWVSFCWQAMETDTRAVSGTTQCKYIPISWIWYHFHGAVMQLKGCQEACFQLFNVTKCAA